MDYITKSVLGKCISRQELANMYGVCRRTIMSRLKDNGITLPPGLITPKWQELIFAKLGQHQFLYNIKPSNKL